MADEVEAEIKIIVVGREVYRDLTAIIARANESTFNYNDAIKQLLEKSPPSEEDTVEGEVKVVDVFD